MKNKENHTHELRYHDYREGVTHSETLAKGSDNDCYDELVRIADADARGIGAGFLLSNGGYQIVNLQVGRNQKIANSAPHLLQALTDIVYADDKQMGASAKQLRMDIARELIEKLG